MSTDNQLNTAALVLRLGLAFVFIYFGFSQLYNPGQWTGFLPAWASSTGILTTTQFVLVNGLFEIVASALLILGVYTRVTALLLALHLFGIAFTIGVNPLGVRDIGLAIATLTLSIIGAGAISVDYAASRETIIRS